MSGGGGTRIDWEDCQVYRPLSSPLNNYAACPHYLETDDGSIEGCRPFIIHVHYKKGEPQFHMKYICKF